MPKPLEPVTRQQAVGAHVRRLREAVGLSLRALAAQTGFSPGFISQLENGQVSPSIQSMEKIAGALGATLGTFFAEVGKVGGQPVVRAGDRRSLHSGWSGAELEALAALPSQVPFEPLLVTLEPGGRSGKHPAAAQRDAFAFVLEGDVTLRLGPDEHQLSAGDAICLLAAEPRLWHNQGQRDCRVLIVSTTR